MVFLAFTLTPSPRETGTEPTTAPKSPHMTVFQHEPTKMNSKGDQPASSARLNGSVRQRDGDSAMSSPERLRQRRCGGDTEEYYHPQVPCFAARNRRGRFYIPLTRNSFGGVNVPRILFDSGCSSLLLPFPGSAGFPEELLLRSRYEWTVSWSRGPGAVCSPVLKIKSRLNRGFTCTLAGKQQPPLLLLRFHLGSSAA